MRCNVGDGGGEGDDGVVEVVTSTGGGGGVIVGGIDVGDMRLGKDAESAEISG
jgi:hypothetical protein